MSAKTVVVGYDGTDGAKAALKEALRVAAEIGGDVIGVFAYNRVITGGEQHDLDAVVHEHGDKMLAEAAAAAKTAGIDFTAQYIEESPASALVKIADHHDARFIVVGSYGERPLKGAIVGSTPNKLIHLSDRPVIVVRIPESE
ncbi:MAG TPA: universal stress protein [Solirubrobacteraceae bacterium]|nr:universal stress protein [Solirubrobacteraceae bacterium]